MIIDSNKIKKKRKPVKNKKSVSKKVLKEHRKSLLKKLGYTVLVAALLATTVYIGFAAHKFAITSSFFNIKEIQIQGIQRLKYDDVLKGSGIIKETNIFKTDLNQVVSKLKEEPWIKEISVYQKLPDKIRIDIRERIPVALVNINNLYILDTEAVIFKRMTSEDDIDLPVITGITRKFYDSKKIEVTKEFRECIQFLHEWKNNKLLEYSMLSEIHLDEVHGLTVILNNIVDKVVLGKGYYKEKLNKLSKVIIGLKGSQRLAEYVMLDNVKEEGRIVTKLKPN